MGEFMHGPQLQSLTLLGRQYDATVSLHRLFPRIASYVLKQDTVSSVIKNAFKIIDR